MLVITGTGRSGTSLLARFCQQMGYDPDPQGSWYHAVNAGLEYGPVVGINHAIGNSPGAAIKERIRQLDLPVIKDPRFVSSRNPRLLETWAAARSDLRFVLLLRDLDCVAKSFHASPGYFRSHAKRSHEELVAHYQERLGEFAKRTLDLGLPVATLEFPACLSDYAKVHRALVTEGGLTWGYAQGNTVWKELQNPHLVHHS